MGDHDDEKASVTLTPELIKAVAELQEWFEKRPDVTKHHFTHVFMGVRLDNEIHLRFFEDSIDIEYL